MRADGGEVLIFTTGAAPPAKRVALERAGATVLVAPARQGRVDLRWVCRHLGERAISSVIVEGGAAVHWSVIEQGIADKALFILAPKIIGGRRAVTAVGGEGFGRLSDCPNLTSLRVFRLGPDLAVEGYLRAATPKKILPSQTEL